MWSKYRGSGAVTFNAAEPKLQDGKATTTATFGDPGEYVLRVINFASVAPSYTVTAAVYGTPEYETTPELVEQWTLVCSIGGQEVARQLVTVDRGQQAKVAPCGSRR